MSYISYSQISMYLRCGEQYRRRYLEKEKIPPGIALIKGSSGHKGIEYNGVQKIETRQDLKKDDIVDYTVEEFDKQSQDEIFLTDEEKSIGKKKVVGKAKDSLVSSMGVYTDDVAPTIQPLEVEKKIYVESEHLPDLLTVIDCIDDKKNIHDYKFTGRKKNQNEIERSLQLSAYYLAFKAEYQEEPGRVIYDVIVGKKKPEYQRLETVVDVFSEARLVNTIEAVYNAIQKGIFLPASEGAWNCDPRYCGYYNSCPYVR